MIAIDNTLVSEDVLEQQFACHIAKCKGACCVIGDAGAPLETDEIALLKEELPAVTPFMSEAGRTLLQQAGFWENDRDGEPVTTCLPSGECVFVKYDSEGNTQCAVELAHKAGKTGFLKPVSCHLYPIRVKKTDTYTLLNYHRWHLCKPACSHGKKLGIPVYRFLEAALVRRFGRKWYTQLSEIAEAYHQTGKP